LHDPDAGVVVCHPLPPRTRKGDLCRDVLHALGKQPAAAGWSGRRETTARYTKLWFTAEKTTDLVLLRADLFAEAPLRELAALAHDAGVQMWFIFDDPARCRTLSDSLNAHSVAGVDLTGRKPVASGPRSPGTQPWPTPSQWVARAAAAHALPGRRFEEIDLRMHVAFRVTSAWLTRQPELRADRLQQFLEDLATDTSRARRQARLYGAVSAMLHHGLLAELREQRPMRLRRAARPSPQQTREIRRHNDPTRAALTALELLTPIQSATLRILTPDQVASVGDGIAVGGYVLEAAGAAAIRAHLSHQRSQGVKLADPMFSARDLSGYQGPKGRKGRPRPARVEIKVAKLARSLDLVHPQPIRTCGFTSPSREHCDDGALILRLLGLSRSGALPYRALSPQEHAAAGRMGAAKAVLLQNGTVSATDHLRFSQFLFEGARYLARLGSQ